MRCCCCCEATSSADCLAALRSEFHAPAATLPVRASDGPVTCCTEEAAPAPAPAPPEDMGPRPECAFAAAAAAASLVDIDVDVVNPMPNRNVPLDPRACRGKGVGIPGPIPAPVPYEPCRDRPMTPAGSAMGPQPLEARFRVGEAAGEEEPAAAESRALRGVAQDGG